MYEQITSTVVSGKHLWHTLGFPTINCPVQDIYPELEAGTYRVNVYIENNWYRWIWPRFPDRQLFEVHLLDTHDDFYGKHAIIIPLVYMRANQTFTSSALLIKQVHHDLERAKTYRHRVITFWTFDRVHPWHEAYLKQAKQYGDILITIVAKDITVQKIKWALPDHDEQHRVHAITDLQISDIVELGDEIDPYTCLKKHTPDLICLWYDQHSFDTWLRAWCDTHWLEKTIIIRLESHHPEKRKSSIIKPTIS